VLLTRRRRGLRETVTVIAENNPELSFLKQAPLRAKRLGDQRP